MILRGRAFVFGKNVDTDQIYPGRYLDLHEPLEIARHAMEGVAPDFVRKVKKGDIIVAATNFGCGSSREHAPIAIKTVGVSVIVAESFAGIFYRNCINIGLPLLICPDIRGLIDDGDEVEIDLQSGIVRNLSQQREAKGEGLSSYVLAVLKAGGIKVMYREKYGQ